MRITLLGKRWNLRFVPGMKDWGQCDNPASAKKEIRVNAKAKGIDLLDTLIHEMLHAAEWHKDETSWIEPVASDMARVLWQLGYRRHDG